MRVAIVGGTGFVGGHLTDALLAAGHEVSLLVRAGSEDKARQSKQVRVIPGDLAMQDALRSLMKECSAVIYNVGILREFPRRGITFEEAQYQGLVRTVEAARATGVKRLLLMSANGVKQPGTPYQETKYRAEQHALQSGLEVTVLRPSVIFGDPEGKMEFATQLFNDMIRPPVPAVAFFTGRSLRKGAVVMSPVYIADVASAFVAALENDETIGKTYCLGGPEVLSWQEMLRRIAAATGRDKWILPMPTWIMRVGATLFDWLPFFPVTRGQLTMLEEGNIADPEVLKQLIGRELSGFTTDTLSYLCK
ncbi:MAG: NAD(P)H-binding protein [Gammaproteobacteria bacterium]|nr:NAD(P)H-binding protein [Gammaproteobacteria bacterium]MBT8110376.1 NAD(P)H-binding protein [Gammaproteobacteria bacterium]NNC57611.1 NAD(P)H-binding protein [Woeseiaceae bacterium]NNL45079.1 NAD(P)H-binding protein [Woeseiaceae bacterium]